MDKHYCPYCMTPLEADQSCRSCGLTAGSYTPDQNHLPPGTVLNGRYLVGRALGAGGFGITYIGCDLRLELKVAIKEYFPTDKVQRISSVSLDVSLPSDLVEQSYQNGKERFLEEARVMARMDKQPEIVSVRDFFEAHNTAYIVMEYVEGTTFKQLVKQRGQGIPPQELFPMLKPLFGALTNLHEMGLIHRDISPDNLMLERGKIRLIDFGCAREPEQGEVTMTIVLKHGYAPIEQYTNRGQGPWTDVYALSATIYFCLIGKTPPRSIDRALDDELILPRKLGVPLTEEQEQALMNGMGVKRRQRFNSVAELYSALYQAAEPEPDPVRVVLEAQAVCSGKEDLSGFVYELLDEDGVVQKTCCTDKTGKAQFAMTVHPSMAGGNYTYYLRQQPGVPEDVEEQELKSRITMSVRLREGKLKVSLRKDDEPVMAGDPFRFVNHLKEEYDTDRTVILDTDPKPKGKPDSTKLLMIGILAFLAVMAIVISVILLSKDKPDTPASSVSGETVLEAGPEAALPEGVFDGARLVTDHETDLLALLEQPSVPAASLRDCELWINQTCTLTKHVRVEEGAFLGFSMPVTVPAGVVLEVEGTLCLGELLTVEQGGFLHLVGSGHIEGGTVVFEDQEQALMGSDHAAITRTTTADSAPHFFDLQIPMVDQNATRVFDARSLREAVDNPETRAIIIDGDIEINLVESLEIRVPTVISEGSLLTVGWTPENQDPFIIVSAPVRNYGRVEGALTYSNNDNHAVLFVNYGELDARIYLGDADGELINYGAMASSELIQVFGGSRLFNLGRMEVLTGDLRISGGEYHNLGETDISRNMEVSGGGHFSNDGLTTVQTGGVFYNTAYTINIGTVVLQAEARLTNEGLLELGGGELVQERGAVLENNTLVQINDRRLGENLPGSIVFFNDRAWETDGEERLVHDEQSLLDAADDEAVGCIVVDDKIEVRQSLDLEKNLIVNGQLSFASGTHLTTRGTVQVNGALEGDSLSIEGGDMICNGNLNFSAFRLGHEIDQVGGRLLNYGTLDLNEGTLELHWDSFLLNYGRTRSVADAIIGAGSVIANRGDLGVTNGSVWVDGLLLLTSGMATERTDIDVNTGAGLRIYGGWMDLEQNSRLIVHDGAFVDVQQTGWHISDTSTVENSGSVAVFGFSDFAVDLDGSYINNGETDVGIPLHLNWLIRNNGVFRLHYGEENMMSYGPNGLVEGNPLVLNQE